MWCFSCRCLILFLERWLFRDASQVTTETLGELCEAALLKTLPKPRSLEMTLKPPAQRCKAMMCARTMGREFTTSVWSKLKAKKQKGFRKNHRGWGVPAAALHSRRWAMTQLHWEMNQKVCAFPSSPVIFRAVWSLKSRWEVSQEPRCRKHHQPEWLPNPRVHLSLMIWSGWEGRSEIYLPTCQHVHCPARKVFL